MKTKMKMMAKKKMKMEMKMRNPNDKTPTGHPDRYSFSYRSSMPPLYSFGLLNLLLSTHCSSLTVHLPIPK